MHNKYRNTLLTTSVSSIWHPRAIIDITSIDLDVVPRTTEEIMKSGTCMNFYFFVVVSELIVFC